MRDLEAIARALLRKADHQVGVGRLVEERGHQDTHAVAARFGESRAKGRDRRVGFGWTAAAWAATVLVIQFPPIMGIVLPAGSALQGGTASVKLSLEGPVERLVTTGSLSLDNTKLAGFDLGGKMAFIETLAGINRGPDTEIRTFGAHLRLGQRRRQHHFTPGQREPFAARHLLHLASRIAI